MILVQNYTLAVLLCALAMICWGSWQNTQNLIGKEWRFELFYWDYSIGILLFAILMAFTFGSFGNMGRSFIPDLAQADPKNLLSAALGGFIINPLTAKLAKLLRKGRKEHICYKLTLCEVVVKK